MQFKEMLQNLIKDRFKLQYHTEIKGEQAYALVVAKSGPKMKESVDLAPSAQEQTSSEPPSRGHRQIGPNGFPVSLNPHPGVSGIAIQQIPGNRHKVVAWQLTMGEFANDLAQEWKTSISDETGLKGKYDFTLIFGEDPNGASPPPTGIASARNVMGSGDLPDVFAALQSQLGLRLLAEKAQEQVMVIDHIQRPSGN